MKFVVSLFPAHGRRIFLVSLTQDNLVIQVYLESNESVSIDLV